MHRLVEEVTQVLAQTSPSFYRTYLPISPQLQKATGARMAGAARPLLRGEFRMKTERSCDRHLEARGPHECGGNLIFKTQLGSRDVCESARYCYAMRSTAESLHHIILGMRGAIEVHLAEEFTPSSGRKVDRNSFVTYAEQVSLPRNPQVKGACDGRSFLAS